MQWPTAKPLGDAVPGTKDPVEIHGFFKSGMVVADVAVLADRLKARKIPFEYELRQVANGRRSFGIRIRKGTSGSSSARRAFTVPVGRVARS